MKKTNYTDLSILELQNLVNDFAKALGPIGVSVMEHSPIESILIESLIKKIDITFGRAK